MNTDQKNIILIDGRISSLIANQTPGFKSTIEYLSQARADIEGRLTEEQYAEAMASGAKVVLSDAQQKAALVEQARLLNENRDKNSI